ncbi:hypothetical protein H7U19_06970 [Hyunsoonleella sp. SJ7]|uniref:Uncharacterized protein n=1 Tax=Hyunsoonleella aquatilis TaxID=2762758 RepID=A0A923KKS2_9FLAO|nr:hypothetical protein [Hyunsoonleella aquatilis]MBC3758138.1 hypothetical protein [Hyunsoonleella aquatilis]
MKGQSLIIILIVFNLACVSERPNFNKKKDILIAQFDSKPDPDDIHAQAALGSMLLHQDLKGIDYYVVAGAVGVQGGAFIDSSKLLKLAFGNKWANAHEDWNGAVASITKKVVGTLKKGGKVWVQEAGQSNITADWIAEVVKEMPESLVKSNVIVVQHSKWNEDHATASDLDYVKQKTSYFAIDDGNKAYGAEKGNRGPHLTPEYRAKDSEWIAIAKSSSNKKARKLWIEADKIITEKFPNKFPHEWSYIRYDGVDYSDCVENWWIFNIGNLADTHAKFWDRYVTN